MRKLSCVREACRQANLLTFPTMKASPTLSLVPVQPVPDDTGLEDFDQSDFVMPRLQLDHKTAEFVDNLSGERLNPLDTILLGLIKQRILWDADEENSAPLCKSLDFQVGRPDEKDFPWKASGFDKNTILSDDGPEVTLPCASCALKEWGTHPKRDAPWCSDQFTFAVLTQVGDGWAPALLTLQRSAIKACKAYLTGFARSKSPLYTVETRIKLTAMRRGTVDYAVPSFIRGDATDPDQWGYYADQYRTIRSFVQTPRATDDEGTAPAGTAAATGAPLGDEEDIPF